MSFIAKSPVTAHTSETTDPTIVENDGWFPDIDLHHMRDAMRLDGTVTSPRLVQAVAEAILHVNAELDAWQDDQLENGFGALGAVPAKKINRESKLVIHYRRAVYSTAKADLLEKYRDYDSTASSMADKKAMAYLDDGPGEQRRNAHWAIADILRRHHLTVELI
ncbi:head completion/stabilization protein [Glaciimonas sp. PAMC28666]|uniref:head completion/stabilization protein n=1 Tax=Glaciimonas sp. PAMC28666 TaxID=2807626 RepID=UPI001963D2AD|nr:head completion/stabilization protein [Glaciimonas sp. PAMC28666]QRX80867.1 head completion/stabilization protein [Glaciimonas sp. PAMC28666]